MFIGETNLEGYLVRQYRINGLIIGFPTAFGPRILQLSPADNPDLNIFGILQGKGAPTPEGFWNNYGGHRLWSSPEDSPRSYSLDNNPVEFKEEGKDLYLFGNPEPQNSIQKLIKLSPEGEDALKVTHRITNIGRWPIKLACWGLSVMKPGGFAVLPICAGNEGLLPDRKLTLWPYTDLADKRLSFQKDFIFLTQVPSISNPIKIGLKANPPVAFYHWKALTFVKRTIPSDGKYPDFGSTFESYANSDFLELESLGTLSLIEPGQSIEHIEIWKLLKTGPLHPQAADFLSLLSS
jgi:hypothetical protein